MEWYGTIDRFEDAKAVILPEKSDSTVIMDKSLLPEDCREGDRIRFTVSIEKADQENRKKHVEDLIEKLTRETQ